MVVGHCLFHTLEGIANVEVFQILDRVLVQAVTMAG